MCTFIVRAHIHTHMSLWTEANHRSIVLLSLFSKVLDVLIDFELVRYLTSHSLLSNKQYGFHFSNSTVDVLKLYYRSTFACFSRCLWILHAVAILINKFEYSHILTKYYCICSLYECPTMKTWFFETLWWQVYCVSIRAKNNVLASGNFVHLFRRTLYFYL